MPAISDTAGNGGESSPAAEPPQRLWLEVVRDSGDWSWLADADAAAMDAAAALDRHPALTFEPASACVALSSAEGVHRLNRDYRHKDKATNVLSFPALRQRGETRGGGPEALGDVVLAAEVVRAEAEEAGIAPRHHFQHLVVHGLLHLIGYDHEQDDEAAVMEGLEIEILRTLGIADPYARAVA
jgi:probable rRNA maturation factor